MQRILETLLPRLGRAPRVLRMAAAVLGLLVAAVALLLGVVAAAAVLLFSSVRGMGSRGTRAARSPAPPGAGSPPAARRRPDHDVVDIDYRETTGRGHAG